MNELRIVILIALCWSQFSNWEAERKNSAVLSDLGDNKVDKNKEELKELAPPFATHLPRKMPSFPHPSLLTPVPKGELGSVHEGSGKASSAPHGLQHLEEQALSTIEGGFGAEGAGESAWRHGNGKGEPLSASGLGELAGSVVMNWALFSGLWSEGGRVWLVSYYPDLWMGPAFPTAIPLKTAEMHRGDGPADLKTHDLQDKGQQQDI